MRNDSQNVTVLPSLLLQRSPVIPVTAGAARGAAHGRGESGGACRHPRAALGLPVPARAATTEPQAGKGLVVTCRGAWEGLGPAGPASQDRLVQTNREAGEMRGESTFDAVH